MGLSCFFGHRWDGCMCTRCGKTRAKGHVWNWHESKCEKCGAGFEEIKININQFDHDTNAWLFLLYCLIVDQVKTKRGGRILFLDIASKVGLNTQIIDQDFQSFWGAIKALASVDIKANRIPVVLACV
ncbi:MAG: hypothetical protein JXR56_01435, partial [Candidatus Cloacimonetes bacterium]|nr:hypothetical protein [Candidatus Cloacimonadota bacterium]